MNVTKAMVPVAGWGTRMLPITKAIEKCMLPVGNRPVVDYVVQDIVKAGIKDIYFVVSQGSTQVHRYYSTNEPLNAYLETKGKTDLLENIQPPKGVHFHFITQPEGKYGTSVPVMLVNDVVHDGEAVLVVMGDQFFYRSDGGSNAADLIALVEERGVSAGLFGVEVSDEAIVKGGAIAADSESNYIQIVEKPTLEEKPSNLSNASFYMLDKELFTLATRTPANPVRGEYELTDVLNTAAQNGKKISVETVRGEYLECGSLDGWQHANNALSAWKRRSTS